MTSRRDALAAMFRNITGKTVLPVKPTHPDVWRITGYQPARVREWWK